MIGILWKKIGMSRIIQDDKFIPVTYVLVPENEILHIRTIEKDGYNALVLWTDAYKKPRKTKKYKFIKEVLIEDSSNYKVWQMLTIKDLWDIETANITAVSKGKGFQGTVKRHKHHVIRKTHGTKYARHGSTMSSCITGRSKPGIKMPGRMGSDTVTLKSRKIVVINIEKNVYAVKGAVPWANDWLVILKAN